VASASEGATRSSGVELTNHVPDCANWAMFPTLSTAEKLDVQSPSSALEGKLIVHSNLPKSGSGNELEHEVDCVLSGAVSFTVTRATPDLASVTLKLYLTMSLDTGVVETDVSAGGVVSGSVSVTANADENPKSLGSISPSEAEFPTASCVLTLAFQKPPCEYRGNVTTQDHVPFCGVPDVGAFAVQLCRISCGAGDVNAQVALATPGSASVSVMLHVTVCEAKVMSVKGGVKVNPASVGAVVSHSAKTRVSETPSKHTTTANAIRMP